MVPRLYGGALRLCFYSACPVLHVKAPEILFGPPIVCSHVNGVTSFCRNICRGAVSDNTQSAYNVLAALGANSVRVLTPTATILTQAAQSGLTGESFQYCFTIKLIRGRLH